MTISEGQEADQTDLVYHTDKLRTSKTSMTLRAAERRWLLSFVDVTLLIAALVASLVFARDLTPTFLGLLGAWKWLVTLAATWFVFASIFDVYNLARAASTTYGVRAAAAAVGMTVLVYLMIPWLTPSIANRSYGFLFAIFSFVLVLGWRVIYAQFFTQPTFQNRAIVLGTGDSAVALVEAMRHFALQDANPFKGTGHIPLGFVTEQRTESIEEVAGLPVLGHSDDLVRLTREFGVDEVILALPQDSPIGSDLNEAILDCFEHGIPVTSVTTIYERLTSRVAVEYVGRDVEMITGYEDKALRRFYSSTKRVIDLLIGFIGMLVLAIFIPPIALANRLSSPGPLFYEQERVGKGGQTFRMFKFRSMAPDAEAEGKAMWARQGDDRVTPAGKWLRRLHLDELPQVYNVLRGDMSLIGPRPERPQFVAILARELPYYRARHCVRPGITGWAQIHQDYGGSVEDAKIKLEYDLYYVKKSSTYLDLVILLRTVTKVLGLKGR